MHAFSNARVASYVNQKVIFGPTKKKRGPRRWVSRQSGKLYVSFPMSSLQFQTWTNGVARTPFVCGPSPLQEPWTAIGANLPARQCRHRMCPFDFQGFIERWAARTLIVPDERLGLRMDPAGPMGRPAKTIMQRQRKLGRHPHPEHGTCVGNPLQLYGEDAGFPRPMAFGPCKSLPAASCSRCSRCHESSRRFQTRETASEPTRPGTLCEGCPWPRTIRGPVRLDPNTCRCIALRLLDGSSALDRGRSNGDLPMEAHADGTQRQKESRKSTPHDLLLWPPHE